MSDYRAILVVTVPHAQMPRRGMARFRALGQVSYADREIRLSERLGRWFPSARRFVLWHEWMHVRIRERFGRTRHERRVQRLHDVLAPFAYPYWRMTH